MNNAADGIEVEGKWAVVETATRGRWQVVNLETGRRSIPMAEESARRVWRALLVG